MGKSPTMKTAPNVATALPPCATESASMEPDKCALSPNGDDAKPHFQEVCTYENLIIVFNVGLNSDTACLNALTTV